MSDFAFYQQGMQNTPNTQNTKSDPDPKIFFPLMVADIDDPALNSRIWDEYDELPQKEQDFITHPIVSDTLRDIYESYSLSVDNITHITRLLREFYLHHIGAEELFNALPKYIPPRGPEVNNEILETIDSKLLSYTITPEEEKHYKSYFAELKTQKPEIDTTKWKAVEEPTETSKNKVEMTYQQALKKFPKIFRQYITQKEIILKGSNKPLPPTLKNWLSAYLQEIGPPPHEPFERSQFLFHNQNTKTLSQEERNILAYVLKIVDENAVVHVNTDTFQLVLPNIPATKKNETQKINQSNQQVLPSQKNTQESSQLQERQDTRNQNVPDTRHQIQHDRGNMDKTNTMDSMSIHRSTNKYDDPERQADRQIWQGRQDQPYATPHPPRTVRPATNQPNIQSEETTKSTLKFNEKPDISAFIASTPQVNKVSEKQPQTNSVPRAPRDIFATETELNKQNAPDTQNIQSAQKNLSRGKQGVHGSAKANMRFSSPQKFPHELPSTPKQRSFRPGSK